MLGIKSNSSGRYSKHCCNGITENSLVFVIPGFMDAALTDALFWLGLGIILPAGYAVAYPAMYWAMKREKRTAGAQTAHHH